VQHPIPHQKGEEGCNQVPARRQGQDADDEERHGARPTGYAQGLAQHAVRIGRPAQEGDPAAVSWSRRRKPRPPASAATATAASIPAPSTATTGLPAPATTASTACPRPCCPWWFWRRTPRCCTWRLWRTAIASSCRSSGTTGCGTRWRLLGTTQCCRSRRPPRPAPSRCRPWPSRSPRGQAQSAQVQGPVRIRSHRGRRAHARCRRRHYHHQQGQRGMVGGHQQGPQGPLPRQLRRDDLTKQKKKNTQASLSFNLGCTTHAKVKL